MHMDTRGYCSIINDVCPYNYDSCNACNLSEEYNTAREKAAELEEKRGMYGDNSVQNGV